MQVTADGYRYLDAALAEVSDAAPPRSARGEVSPAHTASYIYTSGTTGLPKVLDWDFVVC